MNTYFPDIRIGDIFSELAKIPDESVDCVVSSPPYWGLRDYGIEGQLGMEKTLAEHIENVVRYCREIRRILKPGGTFWLNYGDTYATGVNGRSAAKTKQAGTDDRTFRDKPFSTVGPVGEDGSGFLKPKDLCMVPNRVAIALQDDGWWVRSEIIWGKTNPMPTSVKDRPSTAHEKIFLLTKSARYDYDHTAGRQEITKSSAARLAQNIEGQTGSDRAHAGKKTNGRMKAAIGKNSRGTDPRHPNPQTNDQGLDTVGRGSRLLRNYEPAPVQVWRFATQPFKKAHFATFPPELARRCILAGSPEGGVVLDPFGGSGTTGLVARRLGRRSILIELNPEYAEIARIRCNQDWSIVDGLNAQPHSPAGPLFAEEMTS